MAISKVISVGSGFVEVQNEDGTRVLRKGGTVAWRCNNPGNLKEGKFSRTFGSIGRDYGGHAIFPTLDDGRYAQYNLLFNENSRYYNLTVEKAINIYAPASDGNDPEVYIHYVCLRAGISRKDKLRDIPYENQVAMIDNMAIFEGYKEGSIIVRG